MSDDDRETKKVPRRAVLTALVTGACGGPQTTSPGQDPELTVVSVETRLPVAGARLQGPFQGDFITNEEGRVKMPLALGHAVEVHADGYLKRETTFAEHRATVSLWPIVAEDDRHFPALLYSRGELRSLQVSRVAVSFGPGVSDQRIIAAHEQAIGRINVLTDGKIMFVARSSSAQVAIAISVNSEDPQFQLNPMWGGYTSLSISSGIIKGATVVYRDVQRAIVLAQHELGHCLGLGHVSVEGPWMMHPSNYYLAQDFNETEKRALRFSLARQPRWLPLDNDRDLGVVSASARELASVIGC